MHEHEPDRGKAVREFQPTMTEADYDVYPRFRNDIAVSEIRIGAKEFKCIGVSPPHDHPHVYIDMSNQDTILCPYCGTRFRFDPKLGPFEADPPDFVSGTPALGAIASVVALDYVRFRFPQAPWMPSVPHLERLAAQLAPRASFERSRPHA